MASPVEQFKLKSLVPLEVGGIDLSYTTSALWMTITVIGVAAFLTLSMRGGRSGARALAVDGGNVLRIHRQHGA